MTTQIKIGSKQITESLLDGDNVIYLVKYNGERSAFYTIITASKNAGIQTLMDKLHLKDCNIRAPFWANRVSECEYLCTDIPAFNQCANDRDGYARMIIEEFKF